jgi:hypothetical protein
MSILKQGEKIEWTEDKVRYVGTVEVVDGNLARVKDARKRIWPEYTGQENYAPLDTDVGTVMIDLSRTPVTIPQ